MKSRWQRTKHQIERKYNIRNRDETIGLMSSCKVNNVTFWKNFVFNGGPDYSFFTSNFEFGFHFPLLLTLHNLRYLKCI